MGKYEFLKPNHATGETAGGSKAYGVYYLVMQWQACQALL